MFFLTVGRPAQGGFAIGSESKSWDSFHRFGDARMPIWGVLAILSNFLLALFSGEWTLADSISPRSLQADPAWSLSTIFCQSQSIGFRPKRVQKREEGLDNAREAAGVVGSISDDPYSAAGCVPARPVPGIASRFGINAPVLG